MRTLVLLLILLPLHLIGQNNANLICHYPLNGNANDISANQLNGRIVGTVIETPDNWGNPCGAMQFVNGGYIEVPHRSVFNRIQQSISIAAWAKLDSNADNYWLTLVCKGEASETSNSPHFRFQFTKITFALNNRVPTWQIDYQKGQWYFWVVSFDGNFANIYKDGVNIASFDYQGTLLNANSYPMEIGRDITGLTESFEGSIDELMIFDKALSASEVKTLYNTIPSVNCGGAVSTNTNCQYPSTIENVSIEWAPQPIVVKSSMLRLFANASTAESTHKQIGFSLNGGQWKSGYLPSNRVCIFDAQLNQSCNYILFKSLQNNTLVFRADVEGVDVTGGSNECSENQYFGVKIIYEP